MSDAIDPGDTPDLRAAEYVLGTLEPAERLAFEAEMARDPSLLAAVAAWKDWLAPLALTVEPATPAPELWTRLQLATGVREAEPSRQPVLSRLWRSPAVWRTTTAAAMALAASFAFIAFRPGEPKVAVLLAPNAPQPAFLLRATARGNGRIEPLNPAAVEAGRDLELWAMGPNDARPHSLGVLPVTGRSGFFPAPPGTQVLVSQEPAGGSPTGQPTGPVLYSGTLR